MWSLAAAPSFALPKIASARNAKSSLFIMWHRSLNKLISLIRLLFLFIKSGVELVYLKLVRKHTRPGNSLRATRARRSPPRPEWKVFWVSSSLDPFPLFHSFSQYLEGLAKLFTECSMFDVSRSAKGCSCSHTSKTSPTTEVQHKWTESPGGQDGSRGPNECQLTGLLVLIDAEICPLTLLFQRAHLLLIMEKAQTFFVRREDLPPCLHSQPWL